MTPYDSDFWKHSWEEWMETFKVNVMAMYTLCAAFIPGMIERFGRVINLTLGNQGPAQLRPLWRIKMGS